MFLKILKFVSYIFPTLAAYKAMGLFLTPKKYKRPIAEKDWYTTAEKNILKCGFAVNVWGRPGLPKVLLVHGWEGRGSQLGAFAEPLVTAGYQVIALDGPAHGESKGNQTNAGEFSRALLAVQSELGAVEAIIAHSFGGGCTVLAMNIGLVVNKFVTIASPSDYAEVIQNFLNFVPMSQLANRAFVKILEHKAKLELKNMSISSLGSSIKIPILIVHDQFDKEVKFSNALNLHQAWSQSELLQTEGLGHRRLLKDAEVIKSIVQFIQKDQVL